MPQITLDYIHYNRQEIPDLVALLMDGEFTTLKWLDNGNKSTQFIVTHEESVIIVQNLLNRINEGYQIPIQVFHVLDDEYQVKRVIKKHDLSRLNQLSGFDGLIENDVQLSMILDNHYHLDGQLEISLALSFQNDEIVIFDKWSPWKSKGHFYNNGTIRIGNNFNNFANRNRLLEGLADEIYNDFENSLADLKGFLLGASNLEVNGDTLKAVYLDLKDRNRSVTSLELSNENKTKISNDLKRVSNYIGRHNDHMFNYVDFIRIIAISHPQFYYHPQFDFEITTSRAYNSLLKKQKVFSVRDQVKRNYEQEQLHTLNQIIPIL
jgi:hypothetical protein